MFAGRRNELKILNKTYAKEGERAKLIVYKGRRRVGKSTLIEFFMSKLGVKCFKIIGQPPAKVNRTATELSNFAQQLSEQFNIQKPAFADWDAALSMLGDLVSDGNCVLMIDEINWLGKTHDDITTVLFTVWESKLKHIKGFTLILTGSLAGWILENLSESTGWYGRINLDATLTPLPLQDALDIIPKDVKKRMSKAEQIRYMLVSGGIPSYLQSFNYHESLEDNLKLLAFSSSGELFREYDTLMKDLFRAKGTRIKQILDALSKGNLTALEIARKLKLERPNGHLYSDLLMMQHSSFITPMYKWNFNEGGLVYHDPVYVITDPYLRFYYKAIFPHNKAITHGSAPLPSNLDSLLGLQFEYVMRENVELLYEALGLSAGDVLNAAPYQSKGVQIDWLIETKRYFYIVEFKFQSKPLDTSLLRDMDKKIIKVDFPSEKSIRTVVVHVNGASQKVEQSGIIDYSLNLCDLI
ncbi:ATP-binding protein [Vibrio sp. JC009]|uniref:AAA family ATPase n=1 Tax=Vibrio sp. JC009 TaxID=2912314 RepID=UPI0023B0BD2C|nr:ATP-binding protein [Vibrio sp. JC009]WED24000.1 ATP-binding protein [Vibrio sp. JC009]